MKKVRLLHIQVLPIMSGVQKAMLEILKRLDRNTYDITVLCNSEGDLTRAVDLSNFNFIVLPELKRKIHPVDDLISFIKLIKLIKKNKFDIVHSHSSKPGFIGRLAAKAAGIKCIVHTVQGFAFHERSSKLTIYVVSLLEKLAGLAGDKVIFVNNKDRIVASQMNLIPKYKMTTIYNGIDLSSFINECPQKITKDLIGFEKKGAIVGMTARLWKQKAPQDFISSIPFIIQELPYTMFMVIGDGPLQYELEKLSEELTIRKNVIFLGWRNDVKDLLKLLDVFVLPSLWEGLPLSILEAMACSKPVVASNIKGNNELVVHGETGFLVPPENPQKIGERVLELLKNKTLAKAMGQKGYQRVKEKFDIRKTVYLTNLVYETLLNNNNN